MPRILIFLVSFALLAGCSNSSELSKKDDQDLRNNFARALTKEEIARMGGAPKGPANDPKGK